MKSFIDYDMNYFQQNTIKYVFLLASIFLCFYNLNAKNTFLSYEKAEFQDVAIATLSEEEVPELNNVEKRQFVSGVVLDKETKKPVPSATVRIVGINRGTICLKNGKFRLPKRYFVNKSDIRVTAVGYKSKVLTLDLREDTTTIYLAQDPVQLKEVVVIGDINVDEVIRRAIARKEANRNKYKTMQCLLYSKFMLENTMDLTSFISEDDTLQSVLFQGLIGENFSQRFIDIEKNIDKTVIVNRRQTANFPKAMNILTLDEFVDFSEDEISFGDAKIITPLHNNALTHYKFELLEKKLFEDKYVYVIKVIPNTKVYPTFQGTISIIEGTYQLIEVNLMLSGNTKILFFDNIAYYEKFENVSNDIWLPTYMENRADFSAKILPLLPALKLKWNMTAIVSDIALDKPLPDTIYQDNIENKVVASYADSTKSEYWEENSLIALTEKEKEMYSEIDTAAKKLDIDVNSPELTNQKNDKSSSGFSLLPYLRYNRVESFLVGIIPNLGISFVQLGGEAYYSFGQKQAFGSLGINFSNNIFRKRESDALFSVGAKMFSKINVFGDPFHNAGLFFNSLVLAVFHEDGYDYFRSDGWATNFNFAYRNLGFSIDYESRQDIAVQKTTDKGLFSQAELRENPTPEIGRFNLFKSIISFSNRNNTTSEHIQYRININSKFGIKEETSERFSYVLGLATLNFPIFETGYGNIIFLISAAGGLASKNLPVQSLFVPKTNSVYVDLSSDVENTFMTAYETGLGGTEYFSYHFSLDFKDWLWRLMRLPRIKGRGLEFAVNYTTGKFFNKGNTALASLYHSTLKGYYSELGVKIGRIPIPGTDLAFWAIEARLCVGEYAKGNWGATLQLNLPFQK